MKITNNQRYYLFHIARHGRTSELRVARQLEKKGLITIISQSERTEWNVTLAVMHECVLTDEGRALFSA